MGILETLMGIIRIPLRETENDPEYIKQAKSVNTDLTEAVDGFNGNRMYDPIPQYQPTQTERIISNNTNAWIVIGRDRPSFRNSGYGGIPTTGAGRLVDPSHTEAGLTAVRSSPSMAPSSSRSYRTVTAAQLRRASA